VPRNTLALIEPGALTHNLARVRKQCPAARLMAVVKADAYGHRLDLCLPALRGADLLAVATLEEARTIRRLGAHQPVVLLEGPAQASDLSVAQELSLEVTVHHASQLDALEGFGRSPAPRVWLKIDSGMHRLGFDPESGRQAYRRLSRLPGVERINLVSHLANAGEQSSPFTKQQLQRFLAATEGLEGERCLANSAAIFCHPETHLDWVRAGIVLYGISPFAGQTGLDLGLKPVMTLSSELIAINRVPAGEAIGYGQRFVATRDLTVGVAAVGYGDGYPRSVVDGTAVVVNGRRCRLAGQVSMDMITIDLGSAGSDRVGDPVVLWGAGLAVEEIAAAAGTIPYELACRITRRVRYRTRSL